MSSRCYHDFVISVNFAKSLKLQDYRSITSLASGLSSSRITATHWYASRISRPSPQSARLVASVSRWCCPGASCVEVFGPLLSCLGGLSLARCPSSDGTSWSAVRYTLDFPQSSLSLSAQDAPRLPLLLSLLQRRFRSTAGAAILYLSSRPDVGGLPSISPGLVCLSPMSPTLP